MFFFLEDRTLITSGIQKILATQAFGRSLIGQRTFSMCMNLVNIVYSEEILPMGLLMLILGAQGTSLII